MTMAKPKTELEHLETDDPEIAKRHMRLLVAMLLANGRLLPNGGAAKVYGPKGTGRSRIEKLQRFPFIVVHSPNV
jgi:hypothetical protein